MSNNNENKLIPRLRFPEFEHSGEWEVKKLGEVGEIVTGSTPSKNDPDNWNGSFVWVTAQDFTKKYITDSKVKLTDKGKSKCRIIPENSVLVTCIASIGLNAINKVECATNQQINAVVCYEEFYCFEFIYYSIVNNETRLKNIAGKTAVPIVNKSNFEGFSIPFPSLPEQQKIASCLSSLDEVIAGERQRLALLQQHKKGLLQQLFPQEGETVPTLRFKEFEDSGEWEVKKLGEVCDVRDGTHDSPKYVSQGYPLITSKNLMSDGTIDFNNVNYLTEYDYNQINKRSKVDVGDILFGMIGTIGNPVVVKTEGFAIKNVALIKSQGGLNQEFLVYQLKSDFIEKQFKRMNAGGILKFIALGIIRNLDIIVTNKKEQQKIATCLSSLDDVITAQTQKIELLEQHKKGLLQGLFPNVNDHG
jgi:type I restriction enzyme S subunit